MPEKEGLSVIGRINQKIKDAYKKIDIENLEPEERENFSFKLTPSIVPEHLARYNFSIEQIKNEWNETGKGITVLNLASARGYGSQMIKDALPDSRVISLELRFEYIKAQQKKYPNSNGEQVMASAGIIPLASESVDAVDAFEILEHMSEGYVDVTAATKEQEGKPEKDKKTILGGQENLVSEAYRILKKDGIFIVSVPHRYSFDKDGKRTGVSSNKHHLHEPDEDELFQLLKDKGFRDITEYGQIPANKNMSKVIGMISYVLPIRPLWAWKKGRDTAVRLDGDKKPNQVNLTHVFMARK
jgi:SAM-dependent methyltransferase